MTYNKASYADSSCNSDSESANSDSEDTDGSRRGRRRSLRKQRRAKGGGGSSDDGVRDRGFAAAVAKRQAERSKLNIITVLLDGDISNNHATSRTTSSNRTTSKEGRELTRAAQPAGAAPPPPAQVCPSPLLPPGSALAGELDEPASVFAALFFGDWH